MREFMELVSKLVILERDIKQNLRGVGYGN